LCKEVWETSLEIFNEKENPNGSLVKLSYSLKLSKIETKTETYEMPMA